MAFRSHRARLSSPHVLCQYVYPRSCPRRILHHVLDENIVDLDIENCQFCIVWQLVERMEVCSPFVIKLLEPIGQCAKDRNAVSRA